MSFRERERASVSNNKINFFILLFFILFLVGFLGMRLCMCGVILAVGLGLGLI